MVNKIKNKQNSIAIILTAFISIIIYANSLFNPFIWDDFGLIQNNYLIRSFSNIKTGFNVNQNYVAAYYYLGELYYRNGLMDKARLQWQTALKLSPNNLLIKQALQKPRN